MKELIWVHWLIDTCSLYCSEDSLKGPLRDAKLLEDFLKESHEEVK